MIHAPPDTSPDAAGRELADLPIFADLSPVDRAALVSSSRVVDLAAGQWLFHQGEPTDGLYVVRSGRLEVLQGGALINELGRGAILGELGLLTGAARSASVRARRDAQLLRLSRDEFDAITVAHPGVLRTMAATVAGMLQAIAPATVHRPRATVVTVLGADPEAPVEPVERALVTELRRTLRVECPGRVDGVGLERAELASERVVLSCPSGMDLDDGGWRSFCLRQSDRLIVVASSGVASGGGLRPAPADGPNARTDLLLVGPSPGAEELERWQRWIGPGRVQLVGDPSTLPSRARALARRIAGRSVGLVLGGGGARAFTHIGVIDELARRGVEIDRVAGTSLGAWVGACFASGMDADTIAGWGLREFVRRNPYADYTLPRHALCRGTRTSRALARCLGEGTVEELPVEFACVSVDLLARRAVTHRSGSVVDAVRASLSLPVLYPPHRVGGRLHVDGGLIDNLPVAALADPPEGPIIAVNVITDTAEPSAREGPALPPLGETLMRSIMLASSTAGLRAQERADLVIRPDTRGVGLLEFDQLARMRAVGRDAARSALERDGAALEGLGC